MSRDSSNYSLKSMDRSEELSMIPQKIATTLLTSSNNQLSPSQQQMEPKQNLLTNMKEHHYSAHTR